MTELTDISDPFLLAVINKDVETVKRHLSLNRNMRPDQVDLDVDTAIMEASKSGNAQIVGLLLDCPKRPNLRLSDENTGRRVLHYAAENGNVDVAKLIVGAGASLNRADNLGLHPLHLACKCGHVAMIQYLISQGAHINVNSGRMYNDGGTVLHLAVQSQDIGAVEAVLNSGRANIDAKTSSQKDAQTALHEAVKSKFTEGVKLLCERGAYVNATDKESRTPIHFAAETDDVEIIHCLVEHGADLEYGDHKGRRAIHYAVYGRMSDNVKVLLSYGVDVNAPGDSGFSPLYGAVLVQDAEIVCLVLGAGADPNVRTKNPRQDTCLLMASSLGSIGVVEKLLEYGADVKQKSTTNANALHKCLKLRKGDRRDKIVSLLIEAGADLNAIDDSGYTPLHTCVFQYVLDNYSHSTLKLLTQAGAHLAAKCYKSTPSDPIRNSPLCWLVWRGLFDSAKYLVDSGWDLRDESWLYLPGKSREHNEFHAMMYTMVRNAYPLTSICRGAIRSHLLNCTNGSEIISRLEKLELPRTLIDFLCLRKCS